MYKTVNALAATLLAAVTLSACVQTQSAQIQAISPGLPGKSVVAGNLLQSGKVSKIQFGETSATPSGYYAMCVGHPDLCQVRGGRLAASHDGSVILTGAAMDQLNSVNANVNATIRAAYSDAWTPEQPVGDCKDYAMTKRQRLISSGWPSSALPVAVVRIFGEEHLVLIARTNQGDLVLDNLNSSIVPWSSASYSWVKIQSTTDGLAWRAVSQSAL